jgi:hypothetical protein
MNYFYLKVIILICFIIGVSYLNTYILKEPFRTTQKNIVLLGDSILKNNSYVCDGKAVDDLLKERTNGEINIYSLAENNSKIVHIYSQIDKIPIELNNKDTTVFLSAGGNNILSSYVEQKEDTSNDHLLNTMFSDYKNLIKTLQTRMNKAKIVLLDIYYPTNMKYKQIQPIISEWNQKIYNYANERQTLEDDVMPLKVLKISSELTQDTDFTMDIEPSASGGEKIANLIIYF